MTDGTKDAAPANEPSGDDNEDSDLEGGGSINDPLTRRDVEAPRVPFETDPTVDD